MNNAADTAPAAAAMEQSGFVSRMHVSLNVRDIEQSVAFYQAFFGAAPHKRRPGYANFDIARPPLKLALQEHAPTPGVGSLSHLGILVATTDEVQAARERLEASGLVSFDEGDTVCCYARQDKVWATDPDGNSWEVYVLLDEMDDHEDDHFAHGGREASASGTACGCATDAEIGATVCCGGGGNPAPITLTTRR